MSQIAPVVFAPAALSGALFLVGTLVALGIALVAHWGAQQARTMRAVAEAAGQLVVITSITGDDCTPICVPPKLAPLLATGELAPDRMPPWRPEVAEGLAQLRELIALSPTHSATLEWPLPDRMLRMIGARIGDGQQLLLALAEAGPDVTRYNRLETAAVLSQGVAHDLKNMLNTLGMQAELGQERAVTPAARSHFDRIVIGARRAAELVSLMRRYLRGERATKDALSPVPVGGIVHEVVALLRPTMPRALRVALELDPSCAVIAEPVHLHQIVLNLVSNAVHALAGTPSPSIAVTVSPASDAPADAPMVELTMTDNGPGLPAGAHERVFEPFVTTKSASGGTGLGLAVVRAIAVDVLHGDVRAEDAPGGGARFVVRMPAAPFQAAEAGVSGEVAPEPVIAGG